MVTVMALASATAALISGRLADAFGFRKVIRIAFALNCPLIILALITKNVWLATVIVVLLSAAMQFGHSPSVVLGQSYMPNRVGLASGVTLGLAVSMGGICSPLLGKIGDNYGLTTALYVVSGVALVGFIGTLFIREPIIVRSDE
ncbi:MAG: MFS transporter, partial [Oscillospiraceae bacterium]|nr:MFS transporter [Oscillospiraceae bacterium]